ncbi:HNH endonuclease [Brevibacillus sp. NPDC058079]|uniref:HNH endonuclease n=1 Tax=Brevibacillus sp. NPDC058079 TaxID=3346330 RepID=UPI0036EF62F3
MNDFFEEISLDHTKPFITYIKLDDKGKKSKRFAIPLHKAVQMVIDKMAYVKNPTQIVSLYTKETLYSYIQNRDAGFCQICGGSGNRTRILQSKNKGGLHSPVNTIACCNHCLNQTIDDTWIQRCREENIRLYNESTVRPKPVLLFPIGSTTSLFFSCNKCNDSLYYHEFIFDYKNGVVSSSICKNCQQQEQIHKQNVKKTETSIISKLVQDYPAYIEQATIQESSKLDSNREFIYVIHKGGIHVKTIPFELAKRYVEEGMSKFIKEYPYVIFHMYNTSYNKFRQEILNRDQFICHYCGEFGDTLDHILAESCGGLLTPQNSVCACFGCNNEKGDMSYEDFIQNRRKIDVLNTSSPLYKLCVKCNEYRYHIFFKKYKRSIGSTCRSCESNEVRIEKIEQMCRNISMTTLPEKKIWITLSCSNNLHLLNKNPNHLWKIQFESGSTEKISYSMAVSLILNGIAGILYTHPFILIEWNEQLKTFRNQVLQRDNRKCVYCSSEGEILSYNEEEIDGVMPSFDQNMWSTICTTCAKLKKGKGHQEFSIVSKHYNNGKLVTNKMKKIQMKKD